MVKQVQAHALAANPLFIRTLAEELRLFGVHEELQDRLAHYLASQTINNLYERVLQRVEKDCGKKNVVAAMRAIWASRAGLAEKEILKIAHLSPAAWAEIRHALDEALLDTSGRIIFVHDYVQFAAKDRYLATERMRRCAHTFLAVHFRESPDAERRVAEEPYQWQQASQWGNLRQCLTDRKFFEAASVCGRKEELIAYWLNLREHQPLDMSNAYRTAWRRWRTDGRTRQDGELAINLSQLLQDAGYFSALTVELAEQARAIAQSRNGKRSVSVALTSDILATAFLRCGDIQSAVRVYGQAVDIFEAKRVADDEALKCRTNYALCLLQSGELEKAKPMLLDVHAVQSRMLGDGHPDTISTLVSLAIVYSMQGDQAAALEGFQLALSATQRRHGRLHPATAGMLNNLSIALKRLGYFSAARASYERALSIYESCQGSNHPDTLMVMNNLGTLFRDIGDLGAAERLYRKALAGCDLTLGSGHPDTADTQHNLGVLLQRKGDHENAVKYLRGALATRRAVFGAVHPDTAATVRLLESLYGVH